MKLASLDLGFMYGKGIVDGNPIRIKSVVGSPMKLRFEDLRMGNMESDRIQVKYHGQTYFVSDLAIEQSPSVDFSLQEDRFNTTPVAVVTDALLALGLGEGEHDLFIVSGLPVSHYDKYKNAITELFMGGTQPDAQKRHGYEVINLGQTIKGKFRTVQGRFIPQPFGVLVDNLLTETGEWKNKDLAKKTVAVIDIGFGTSDIYTTNSLDVVESLTFSTNTAMNHAYNLIAMEIEEKLGVSPKLHQMETFVCSSKFKANGKVMRLASSMARAYEQTAIQLIGEIRNKWRDNAWKVDHIIVGGGGGEALYPFLENAFDSIELTQNPQMSVVTGYNKWGMKLWRDRLATALHV